MIFPRWAGHRNLLHIFMEDRLKREAAILGCRAAGESGGLGIITGGRSAGETREGMDGL